ncbi:MAG: glycosyltransferase [Saprospirales bacterium]|nr:glycosyltransferase [Saprospirales bacterium]
MSHSSPLVSICMISFNVEAYIADAIEGVLIQEADFPVELVIGDDCSTDRTREIAREYAARYPDKIRLLTFEDNMGIAGNTARTLEYCIAPYIAICDSDDVWTDPLKLKKQVDFLEKNPDYGAVYTDVQTISEKGAQIDDPEIEAIRYMYSKGDIFFQLLEGNFISNSTTVFRREFLDDHTISPYRNYFVQDYILWVHIATRAKIQYFPERTTLYRKHSSSVTSATPAIKLQGNKRLFHLNLYKAVADFDRFNTRKLTGQERTLLFRKMLSLVYRRPGTLGMKLGILRLMPKYFPGLLNLLRTGYAKVQRLLPA